uniref:NAD-dependent epimerase/dehydratase domain-containing protein n=1 Tax=Nelumbo nucifera TaxID=4432 RepID=A0A822XL37_NELNU|nr:TPA_asm: hypothetical protein HUJ06_023787 [Nelumbo nucifera]
MKVLVTGASGYLGGNLCRALLRQGYSVRAFVRPTSDVSLLGPASATHGRDGEGSLELVYGDVNDLPSLLVACSGCQVIFHVAALVEPWLPDPSRFFSVNVGGLKNVLQAFRETKTVEKIIYTSSFFALGPTDGYIADEKQTHPEKSFCTEYEKSKAMADKVALQAASDGLPIIVLYPGVIYGSGKLTAGNVVAKLLIERFNGRLPGYIGSGQDKFSFSHVEDVIDGHIAALKKGRPGERYLLTGENASFVHVFNVSSFITELKQKALVSHPFVAGGDIWMDISSLLSNYRKASSDQSSVYVLRHQWAYSCEKAKVELGYNPRSLKEGLGEVLPWLKSLGLIKY